MIIINIIIMVNIYYIPNDNIPCPNNLAELPENRPGPIYFLYPKTNIRENPITRI